MLTMLTFFRRGGGVPVYPQGLPHSLRFWARRFASRRRLVVDVAASGDFVSSATASCSGSGVKVGRSDGNVGGATGVVGRNKSGLGSAGLSARTLSRRASN